MSNSGEAAQARSVFEPTSPNSAASGFYALDNWDVLYRKTNRFLRSLHSCTLDKAGKPLYAAQIIPSRGAWLEFETDKRDIVRHRLVTRIVEAYSAWEEKKKKEKEQKEKEREARAK